MELKNIEINKKSISGLHYNTLIDRTKERINELEDRTKDITQNAAQRDEKSAQRHEGLVESKLHLIGVPEEENKENGRVQTLQQITAQNYP